MAQIREPESAPMVEAANAASRAASRAAACWLELLQRTAPAGQASATAAFTRWLMADTANQAAWHKALAMWHCFDVARGDKVLEAMRHRALAGD